MSSTTVIEPRWVVPVEPANHVLAAHAVVIEDDHILAVLPVADAASRYPGVTRIHLPDHVLIPGLVNLHTHAAMTLMRGMADDRALMDWLQNHIWPAEAQLVSDEFVYDGTLLACAEMLRGGITCFNDMYFFPEAAARAALRTGMRAALGIIAIEFRSAYASDAQDYLAKGMALRDTLRDEPLLSFCLAPHAPFTVSDATFAQIATYAGELELPVHIHIHETAQEISDSMAQHGVRPLARLEKAGLLGPGLIAVHSVNLDDHEIALFARHGCSVAHCPSSNLKLASGIAPVAKMLKAGINIGLGTDGAASNNRLDLFSEMRLAALLAKGGSGDATVMPAHTALECATLGGARALGLQDRIGSIVPGKLADLTAVNLAATALSPCYDPVSHLVYAAGREHVSDVWVGGERRLVNGELINLDESAILAKARQWQMRIRPS
ncbi:MAG: TRZ/ATZ family hydrolase [Burkholderiales bacterium]|jgi:5-methylthioadenosine/S-adenosylhomocysteine deaminase|nr:TRZ/ATZ family hydrolase [Burkholderiales bacterium]